LPSTDLELARRNWICKYFIFFSYN
jgi:hypothetical protein